MIAVSRTLTCDFCGQWTAIDDTETAREARKRTRTEGWRTLPHAGQDGRVRDVCPRCVATKARPAKGGHDA